MKRIAKPPTIAPDITYDELLGKTKEIMRREVSNLLLESAKGKLGPQSSNNLVQYVKALQELSDREEGLLSSMTEDQLKAIINENRESKGSRTSLAEKTAAEGESKE